MMFYKHQMQPNHVQWAFIEAEGRRFSSQRQTALNGHIIRDTVLVANNGSHGKKTKKNNKTNVDKIKRPH